MIAYFTGIYNNIRTYVLEEQNQVHQTLWIKVTFQTVNWTVSSLMLFIFQFNCISPKYFGIFFHH